MDRSYARLIARWAFATVLGLAASVHAQGQAATPPGSPSAATLRVATFNIWDVRTGDLKRSDQPRVRAIAETIQRLRPNVILLNEIAYDQPGAPGVAAGDVPGQNARRFVENYLAKPQAEGLAPIEYQVFMAAVNTGQPSGFDLDNDGEVVTSFPLPAPANADGTPGEQSERGRAYGNDCWGFGTFPGQYGMALLVDKRLKIQTEDIRTFRLYPWEYMPGALLPTNEQDEPWYDKEELSFMRLSSKSHWDVPIKLGNGSVVHMLCSHPTPPAFDGPENRNKKRNHDEIRFWRDYIAGASAIVDDEGKPAGLRDGSLFVILGDLNADSKEGTGIANPITDLLLANRRIGKTDSPVANPPPGTNEDLDATDTATFGKQADYVIPSAEIEILRSGIWRHSPSNWPHGFPSDHFPVWMELEVPARR